MEFHLQQLYHVYNRGNNQQPIFYTSENYIFFLRKMRRHLIPYSKILAYCLMPNHFHWLLYVKDLPGNDEGHPLNQQICTLLSSYAQAVNNRYDRTGSLFQQKTKAVPIDSHDYGLTCFHYIHQNPIRANLVSNMGEWLFSSYPDYAGIRRGTLVSKTFTLDYLNIKEESFIRESRQAIDPKIVEKIS